MIRNAFHLGVGQVATAVLGFVLVAALGRSLGASDFGVYYIVLTIWGFVGVAIDWGQGTYLVREAARGRSDQATFIGGALVVRTLGWGCALVLAAAIAKLSGYDDVIVILAPLAVLVGLPFALSQPLCFVLRGKERMDLDAIVQIVAKALTLIATLLVLAFGGGVIEVVIASGAGGIGALLVSLVLARQLDIKVAAPAREALYGHFRTGLPIAALALVILAQPLLDVLILSLFTGREVVGWYGAARSILGMTIAPAGILVTASFPEMVRVANVVPDLRRVLASNARLLLIVGAAAASVLYLFAPEIVAIIYGHQHFEQAVPILRVAAVFMPLICLGYSLGTATTAMLKMTEMALAKAVAVAVGAAVSFLAVGYFQARFGNGAIALVITAGFAEIFMLILFAAVLPRGAVTSATLIDLFRAYVTAASAALPLSTLGPLPLLVSAPLFMVAFGVIAMATRLVVPADIEAAIGLLRTFVLRRSHT